MRRGAMRVLHAGPDRGREGVARGEPASDAEQFLVGMEGNICRCTGYSQILHACKLAADEMGLKKK